MAKLSILTQRNHFLINLSVLNLVRQLAALGVEVNVYFCSATPRGKRVAKWSTAIELFWLFGPRFFFLMCLNYLYSSITFSERELRQFATVVDVADSQPVDPELFLQTGGDGQALLILSGTRIIKADVLSLFSNNVINVHSSLLPYARGLMPAFWTFHKGKGRGVTLFKLDRGIDSGEILYQVPINQVTTSYVKYLKQTKEVGVSLLMFWVLENLIDLNFRAKIESTYYKYPSTNWRKDI